MPTTDDDDKANEQRNAQEDRERNRFPVRMAAILLLLCLVLVFSWYILRSGT